jgi:hypothetical protein
MWLTSKQAIVLAVVGVAIYGVTAASAQFRGQPPIVRFVGTFQPFDEKAAGNLNTLIVSYQERRWLFQVERMKAMGGGTLERCASAGFFRHNSLSLALPSYWSH